MRVAMKRSRKGSIVLEASISISLVILLLCAMISSMTAVNADMYIQRATENVVSEMNVAMAFLSNGISSLDEMTNGKAGDSSLNSMIGQSSEVMNTIHEMCSIDSKDILSTATIGRYVRDRIQVEYDKLIDNGWVYQKLIKDLSVYVDINQEERSIYLTVFYDIDLGSYSIPREYCTSLALYADDISISDGTASSQSEGDDVWQKDNFERGIILRGKYGGNLPHNFPVICSFNNGQAISVKSIDTTSPQYQNLDNLEHKIKGYIKDLEKFEAAQYGEYSIEKGEISSKKLILVVPNNGSKLCDEDLEDLKTYANERQIELEITRYGYSSRYEESDD